MLNQELLERIIQKSISFEKYGLKELAWKKQDAIELICSIMIGILGGDVYKLTSTQLEALSENWYSDRQRTESEQAYYLRSKFESLKYIENFLVQIGEGDAIFNNFY